MSLQAGMPRGRHLLLASTFTVHFLPTMGQGPGGELLSATRTSLFTLCTLRRHRLDGRLYLHLINFPYSTPCKQRRTE